MHSSFCRTAWKYLFTQNSYKLGNDFRCWPCLSLALNRNNFDVTSIVKETRSLHKSVQCILICCHIANSSVWCWCLFVLLSDQPLSFISLNFLPSVTFTLSKKLRSIKKGLRISFPAQLFSPQENLKINQKRDSFRKERKQHKKFRKYTHVIRQVGAKLKTSNLPKVTIGVPNQYINLY